MPIGSTPNETAARIVRAVADPSITAAVREAALATGTQFDLLMASAKIESGFRADARASTSSATGLFQFTEQTWLNAIRTHGPQHGLDVEAGAIVNRGGRLTVDDAGQRQRILALRNDPRVASAMAGNHLREIADRLETGLGRTPEAAEIYLGHFLGSAGARRMLSAPESQAAASILPDAARSNTTLFYSPDGSALSVKTFLQRIRDKVGQAFSDIGAAIPNGPMAFADKSAGEKKADPPDAGALGWGTSTPRRRVSSSEMMMMASLAEVVSRSNHGGAQAGIAQGGTRQNKLPAGMLSALQISAVG